MRIRINNNDFNNEKRKLFDLFMFEPLMCVGVFRSDNSVETAPPLRECAYDKFGIL
jgi:hypothetical protein